MRIPIILLLSGLFAFPCPALDKSQFDLPANGRSKLVAGTADPSWFPLRLQTDQLDMTMIAGGYFTVGTTLGASDRPLDDLASITFGHPYAKTSYPIFGIDGEWMRLDQVFPGRPAPLPYQSGDTLTVDLISVEKFSLAFSVINDAQGANINLKCAITNLDTIAHQYGLALVFDPALGRWGDGHLEFEDGFLTQEAVFTGSAIPAPLTLRERDLGALGMGATLYFTADSPDTLAVANWPDVYANNLSNNPAPFEPLYDLALKIHWNERELQPGETREVDVFLILRESDFDSNAFIRWDLPSFFTLTQNLMFPRELSTYLQIANNTGWNYSNARLVLDLPPHLSADSTEFRLSLRSRQSVFQKVKLRSKLAFEDKIEEVNARLLSGDQLLDEFRRRIFIPATPVSDTGLVVHIDSIRTAEFPLVELLFEASISAGNQLLTDLNPENIFLSENDQRIPEFTMGKDGGAGANSVDIVFVFDVTGSMGEEIEAVKENIIEFADSLSHRRFDFRLGMVTFLDRIEMTYPFTDDPQEFRSRVARQFPHGGGASPENSLDGLMEAAQFDFRPDAQRIVIWITDAPFHEDDSVTSLTKQEVIDALLAADVVANVIGTLDFKVDYYDPIVLSTGGQYFDIQGKFRDILLEIARLELSGKYRLSYLSPNAESQDNAVTLEVRYAGLGGQATRTYGSSGSSKPAPALTSFPNPFNSAITFLVEKAGYREGTLQIYNVLGQKVHSFTLDQAPLVKLHWNPNAAGGNAGSGLYFARLSLVDDRGDHRMETARVLFLK